MHYIPYYIYITSTQKKIIPKYSPIYISYIPRRANLLQFILKLITMEPRFPHSRLHLLDPPAPLALPILLPLELQLPPHKQSRTHHNNPKNHPHHYRLVSRLPLKRILQNPRILHRIVIIEELEEKQADGFRGLPVQLDRPGDVLVRGDYDF